MNNTNNSKNVANGDEEAADYRVQMYRLVVPAFLSLSLLAILANSLVILALRASHVRNSTVTLLTSLTFSDIWTCSVMALSLLFNSYLPIVFHTRLWPCLALILEMLRTGGLLSAAFHLLLIALHHCVGIARPHCDRQFLRRLAFRCSLLAWFLPPSLLFLLSLIRPNQGLWHCERVDFYYERQFRWAISGLLLLLFLAISFCYASLLHLLYRQSDKLSSSALMPIGERKCRRERRILGTTLLICLSFLFGWAPASILFALTCSDCRFLSGSFWLLFGLSCTQLSFLLAKSLVNPLIYSLRIPEVRQQFGWPLIGRSRSRGGRGRGGEEEGGGRGGGNAGINLSKRPSWSHLFASSFSSFAHQQQGGQQHQQQHPQANRPISPMFLLPNGRENGHQHQWQMGERLTNQRRSEQYC